MKVSAEIKVGIMVTVALTILGILIISSSGTHLFQKGYTLRVYFDYVSGLDTGAPVRLAGMEIGEVTDLKLVDEKIEVTLRLIASAKVRSDSKVTINSLGIVGEKYVEITFGTPNGKILKEGDMIQGINPVNVEEILTRTEAIVYKSEKIVAFMDKMLGGDKTWIEFDKIIKNTVIFTAMLKELLGENKEDISSTIKNLHSICFQLKKIIEENREDIGITTKKLKQITSGLQETSIGLTKMVDNLNNTIGETKKQITNTFTELNVTLDSIQKILQKVEKGEGSLCKLLSDKKIADHLSNAAKNIEELTIDLKKSPWKLIRKEK